jgi:hypothetical protein
MKRVAVLSVLFAGMIPGALAQNKAIGFDPKMPFSDGYVAGNTLYVAGQQGPVDGKVEGVDIETQDEWGLQVADAEPQTGAGDGPGCGAHWQRKNRNFLYSCEALVLGC